jgi:hypothetical protein
MAATAPTSDQIVLPLEDLSEAEIRVGFGGGELTLGPADPGVLVSGSFEGGMIQRTSTPGKLALEPKNPGRPLVTWRPVIWNMAMTTEIPVDFRLDTGANRSTIDLSAMRIRRLELHTGASETRVRLPANGRTTARIECGFAAVQLVVPQGVAARIGGSMGLGALTVDEARFPRTVDGWASEGFDAAANRIDIVVAGGFGTVSVG